MKIKFAALMAGLVLLTAASLASGLSYKDTETVYAPESLIRLHVVSNSDSSEDQELKRKVRDEIVTAVGPAFTEAENIASARYIAEANLDHIREIAALKIRAEGKDYPVQVELNSFSFPTKHYGPFILPAGDYEAVRVTIGAGSGANWWCVLYPPLCFVDMTRMMENSYLPDSAAARTDTAPASMDTGSQPSAVAVLQITTSGSEEEYAVAEEQVTVEYRFKILDFFKSIDY
ncbi:stage II sporulation protein R [Pelotomaculum propionicicum]|uniref:stage II sporulation protein R n=1 Tax=Pelotomaculum propionicicum TaxID=258475 RepID=UPI003B7C765F